jgi:hypothetical protein
MGLQSQNFKEIFQSFLSVEGSTLEPNISGSAHILLGVYILIRKVFSQFSNEVIYKFLGFLVFQLEQRRPTQVGLWAADQLFSHILGRNLSKT